MPALRNRWFVFGIHMAKLRVSRLRISMAILASLVIFVNVAAGQQAPPQQTAPRYSLSIPSFDEISPDAIPRAPAPSKRQPAKPAPVPKSPEEAAAFDKIVKEQKPDERIQLVEDFLLAYPESEFKQAVYLAASEAYRRKNDLPRMLTYAELTLAEDPENLQAMLTLAESLPESVRRDDPDYMDRIEEAQEYAHKTLETIAQRARPASATPEQWAATRKQVELSAHLTLALTAMMREDYAAAETEYTTAFKLMEKPDALSLYRLGLTYSFLKKFDEATAALQKSAEAGGVKSRTESGGTRDLVAEAMQLVGKQKTAATGATAVPASDSAGTDSNEPADQSK
jgi:tetratricopeptide (TPR) repeat protein